MTLLDILSNVSTGTVVSTLVIVLSLIEVTPIKLSPLKWIGDKCNKGIMDKLTEDEKRIKAIDDKMNEHIAQSYRNKILQFQNECLDKKMHTQEEFNEVLDACQNYQNYVQENKLKNDKCDLAICYIKRTYEKCLDERSFLHYEEN